MYLEQSFVTVVCPIEYVVRTRFIGNCIHRLDVIHLRFGYMNEGWYLSLNII